MNKKILENFIEYLKNNKIAIYNEFNLQHELGIYLRNKIGKEFKIEFEKNVYDIKINGKYIGREFEDIDVQKKYIKNKKIEVEHLKKEMDIYIENKNNDKEKYAIEIKFPSIKRNIDNKNLEYKPNGAYNQEMYQCIKDIKFMERLKKMGFTKTYCFVMVSEVTNSFYNDCFRKNKFTGYKYFRIDKSIPVNQLITKINYNKNSNKENKGIVLTGKEAYKINWLGWNIGNNNNEKGKYYIIEISN